MIKFQNIKKNKYNLIIIYFNKNQKSIIIKTEQLKILFLYII